MFNRAAPLIAMISVLSPGAVGAQTATQSFDSVQGLVKVGQTVVVTDKTGLETTGQVAEVSGSSLALNGPAGRQTFDASSIRRIKHRDPLANGLMIGLLAGVGVAAAFDAGYCRSGGGHCEGIAGAYLSFGGIGAAAGLGIDALRGGRLLYESSSPEGVTLSPVIGRERFGMLASIRF
jgi:hypothetical protein